MKVSLQPQALPCCILFQTVSRDLIARQENYLAIHKLGRPITPSFALLGAWQTSNAPNPRALIYEYAFCLPMTCNRLPWGDHVRIVPG